MQEGLQGLSNVIPAVFLLFNTVVATDPDGNHSDIFVSYAGHSEARDNVPILMPKSEAVVDNNDGSIARLQTGDTTEFVTKPEADDVVFIPNDKPVFRNEDEYLENNPIQITDMMNNRKLSDVVEKSDPINEDILFVSGKNNENAGKSEKKDKHEDSYSKKKEKTIKVKKLDCTKLDCDNTVNSICGGKMDDKKWKYRLFLNECYFRKVNCAFKYPNNRYSLVAMDKCSHIRNHSNKRPELQPISMSLASNIEETRRSFFSRRSLNADINGKSCSHPCPVTCTERYEPQCAMSSTGQRHTFLNHCKLDYNSCLHKVAWHIRPLSECVGGRKADIQQNRGFIGWMQKVGIVDSRGRLTLSKEPRPR